MSLHADAIRIRLSSGPLSSRQLIEVMSVSQPTISRALLELDDEIVRIGAARSIQYALRDTRRGLPDIPINQVDAAGHLRQLGILIPVRPEGFVMRQADGVNLHSDGLPWWLSDMRPQGYLGRAYATRHGIELGLPERLNDWSDTHVLRALLAHGHDVVGNFLLGDAARNRFLSTSIPIPISEQKKAAEYVNLANEAAFGEIAGSSAGGEQAKFTTRAMTSNGSRYVIVKFSEQDESPVSERWRDLLLAEHLALETLREANISAAQTQLLNFGGQRFLEVERFDRIGDLGRCALHSLATLDAEFIGAKTSVWPVITRRLAVDGEISQLAADGAALLWAFGSLIGNSDMHCGNLSFIALQGRPYDLAPAYDMTPMSFAPRTGGGLPNTLVEANIHASVDNETWRAAETLARAFLAKVMQSSEFSPRFSSCIAALQRHIETAGNKIKRLG